MKCKELIRLLMRAGWFIVRQTGSHIIMRHLIEDTQIVVPMHGGQEMGKKLLRKILKRAGMLDGGRKNEKN